MSNQREGVKSCGHSNLYPGVTLVITSCGREPLLHKTCMSFGRFNTYPLYEVILIEDGGINHNRGLIAKYLNVKQEKIKIIKNNQNIGQIQSIDIAYSQVRSEYIFHCEDDWEFYREGFIENSLDIIESDSKIFCVWIRAHDDTNGHPINMGSHSDTGQQSYFLMGEGYKGVWYGFTFNPSLRRTQDCFLLFPYADLPIAYQLKNRTKITESDISIHYHQLGYKAAISADSRGYVRHIGEGHHIANEWEFKFIVQLKSLIKRLIKS